MCDGVGVGWAGVDGLKGCIGNPFVMAMGDGSLPLDSFKNYMVQDYLYLVHCHPRRRLLIDH